MVFYDVLAKVVALVGAGAVKWRSLQGDSGSPAVGDSPQIPAGRPQGSIPTLKMPTARGWAPGEVPQAAPGLRVNAFASGLKHPRWILVLPNGDVTVAEALQSGGKPQTLFDHAMVATMRRAAAFGESPNRITLLRDADGDGTAEERHVLLENQKQPFGMALVRSPEANVARAALISPSPFSATSPMALTPAPISANWALPSRTVMRREKSPNAQAAMTAPISCVMAVLTSSP